MEKREIGKSGLVVSAVGLGCWAIGGETWRDGQSCGWSRATDEESVRAIQRALELGAIFLPLLMINLSDGLQDIMYKGILNGIIAGMEWGTGDYIYYIKDAYTPEGGESDNINDCIKVDMGEAGSPLYGGM